MKTWKNQPQKVPNRPKSSLTWILQNRTWRQWCYWDLIWSRRLCPWALCRLSKWCKRDNFLIWFLYPYRGVFEIITNILSNIWDIIVMIGIQDLAKTILKEIGQILRYAFEMMSDLLKFIYSFQIVNGLFRLIETNIYKSWNYYWDGYWDYIGEPLFKVRSFILS